MRSCHPGTLESPPLHKHSYRPDRCGSRTWRVLTHSPALGISLTHWGKTPTEFGGNSQTGKRRSRAVTIVSMGETERGLCWQSNAESPFKQEQQKAWGLPLIKTLRGFSKSKKSNEMIFTFPSNPSHSTMCWHCKALCGTPPEKPSRTSKMQN